MVSLGLLVTTLSSRRPLPYPPVEPPPTAAAFPDPRMIGPTEVLAVSRTMTPGLVLAAYRRGIFPWPVSQRLVPWVSPDPRAIFPMEAEPQWPRSLRKIMRRAEFSVTIDRAFHDVVVACGSARTDGTWITPDVIQTYGKLHELGWAHSVEVWGINGALAGGLYGIAIGGAFVGESMFHRETNASKVAFVSLVERLRARGFTLLDTQVLTDHLASLGCIAIGRAEFLNQLAQAHIRAVRFPEE